ncbi:MAG: CDC27 family protein [Bacteriovorax sp.]|nr:CDC27 family protein [Bacteriovorax sp.]
MRGLFIEVIRLHQLIDEKKWTLIFKELDQRLLSRESFEDNESLVSIFESIDKTFREEHAQKYYFEMWKVAFHAGKIKLAKSYAEFVLDYLIEFKRVPAIKQMISDLAEIGLMKSHKKFLRLDTILGKKGSVSLEDCDGFESHPEMWKDSKFALKSYLTSDIEWTNVSWKLAYEYILKFYYDKDILFSLAEKTSRLNKHEHKKKFLTFLNSKKVNTESLEDKKILPPSQKKDSSLNFDYDQLAMDVMSGVLEPSITEQKKILVSIQELSEEELITKGKDMIVAFGLLGMDKVVVRLCEKVIPLLTAVDQRAGVQFMLAQSLFNNGDFHKVIDIIDDTFNEEPLLPDEMLAFNYLKAESYFKLKKYKAAKDLFVGIKKYNPHYRLVGERLRNIEEIK